MRAKYPSVTDRAQVRPVFFGQLWIAPPFTFKSVPSLEDKLCKHSIKQTYSTYITDENKYFFQMLMCYLRNQQNKNKNRKKNNSKIYANRNWDKCKNTL